MKNLRNYEIRKGFTLIELLIVIALLGALAIGLLATIDPFEQLKKGRDTATRNSVTEFYNANLRYYGTKGEFSWGTAAANFPNNMALTATQMTGAITGFLAQLMTAGELKTNFVDVQGVNRLSRIVVTSTAADDMGVCFLPESKNFRLDTNTIYNISGVTLAANTCIAQASTGITTCYWCVH